MAAHIDLEKNGSQMLVARARRFMRWLGSPHVLLSLIMLVLLIYLIIIPLYRMMATTLTFQEKDLIKFPDATAGSFTFYHWIRMLSSKISMIMLYVPLQHSLVVSAGATAIAMALGCLMA